MTIKNKKLIDEFLNIENIESVSSSDLLEEYEWDSLAIVLIQSHFSDLNGTEIDPEVLEKFETIQDLDDFLTNNL